MGKTLVVVESPAKAKTIKKYLGSSYEVLASKGHVKDLPKKMGIDFEKGFQETYEIVPGKEKVLAELKAAAKEADDILLATDPDREGEAIAWHLAEELTGKPQKAKRVEFHEITKNGVQKGVSSPRSLNKNLYDAQRARRVLDRIVGYDVSALVWSKLAFGLSAGRVQSVALRLIVDKEREIEAFVPEEYWNIGAQLAKVAKANGSGGAKRIPFATRLSQENGKKIEVKDGATAARVKGDLQAATYRVAKITTSERKRKPYAPYTTSKLQQDAVNRLGFGAKRTMQVAQGLYEGVDLGKVLGTVGLITYMRTDSTRVSPEALQAARDYISNTYGKDALPKDANVFKSKKSAQDAHEAVRPTSLDYPPETVKKHLKDEQYKLYKLIWERFIASQMKDAIFDQTSIDIEAKAKDASYTLRASGRILKFPGWLEVYGAGVENEAQAGAEEPEDKTKADEPAEGEATLPELKEGDALELVSPPGVLAEQKFTQPPARYNEGSLVRDLEDRGIGRPSTYAEIISKVQARDYVEKLDGRSFRPTLLGKMVVDGLLGSQLEFMDPTFTSSMEDELDQVEAGNEERTVLLSRFYKKFRQQLDVGKKGKRWNPEPVLMEGEFCDTCGPDGTDEKLRPLPRGTLSKRWSKNGWFAGCSNYPKCKATRDMGADGNGSAPPRETDFDCDKCGKKMAIRSGRYGEYLSCTGYPACKNARPVPLGVPCPKCGGDIIEVRPKKKGGKTFYGCSRYNDETVKCDFKLWMKPIPEPCPACGAKYLVIGGTKAKPHIACADKECGYKRAIEEPGETAPKLGPPGAQPSAAAPPA
jgi:DNA topoisomerase-1